MATESPTADETVPERPSAGEAPERPVTTPWAEVARGASEPAWVRWAPLIAVAVGVLFFCGPIKKSGIWDPFELTTADLSRRIAIHVLGASSLELEGADNSMPRLGDLGKGELPFDSIATGFRISDYTNGRGGFLWQYGASRGWPRSTGSSRV